MKLIDKIPVEFGQLKNNRSYKIIFEEEEVHSEPEDCKKQSMDWGKFSSKDVMVFSMGEILKMKEEKECEALVIKIKNVG